MKIYDPARRIASAMLVLPIILFTSASWAQEGDQLLAEGAIAGSVGDNQTGAQGVFNPDFESMVGEPDYETLVAPAGGRDLKDVAIAPDGLTVVLDGNVLHGYDASGDQSLVIDCSALEFTGFKKNGQPLPGQTLSSCSAFTVLLDGTFRIAGQTGNGGGFDLIAHNPSTEQTWLAGAGTPPEVTAIVGDLAEKTVNGQVYYWVGERKKIGKSDYNEINGNLEPFEVIATLNGKRIDDLTVLGDNRLAVITDDGELYQVNATTGASLQFDTLDTGSACNLGKKDPQSFSLSNLGGQLFVGNRGCTEITIYDDQDPPQIVQDLTNNPLELALTDPSPLYTERFEVFAGRGGDFDDCGTTEATGCPLALQENGGVMWNITNIAPEPTIYREFQFVVADCRLEVPVPVDCPVGNDGSLDLTELWLRTQDGPLFRQLAFGDGPVQRALLPGYLTAQTRVPSDSDPLPVDCDDAGATCIDIDPEIISIVVITDALFTDTFFVDYRLNEFLPMAANDACIPLPSGTSVGAANEVYPAIVYHSTDGFGTVDLGGDLGTRGGYLITNLCNNRGSGPRWSSNTINVEFTDEAPDALVLQAHRMAGEIDMVIDDLICSAFPNPDGGPDLGPLLPSAGPDCSALQNEMDQVKQKLAVCFAALYDPQGNSEENCNALFTKTTNLQSRIDAAAWPDPFNPANFDVLRPNYQGELESRLAAFVFFMQEFVLKAVPQDGNGIPGTPPPPLP